jgi:hypothetical protein
MSVSSKADAEGGKWSAWVAAVVAQRDSEVDRPSSAERADDEVAQAGHDLRCGPGADLGAILGEGDVADPVQAVLDLSSRLRLWNVTVEGFGEAGVDTGGAAPGSCQSIAELVDLLGRSEQDPPVRGACLLTSGEVSGAEPPA